MSSSTPQVLAGEAAPPASRWRRLFGSSIGQKLVMAATGIVLSVFVLGHMAGNLTAFQGAEAIDAYGASVRRIPPLLWAVRAGLLLAVTLHIWAYLALTRTSLAARPQAYRKVAHRESSFASRSMRWTGPLLAAFIVFHLFDLTIGTANPSFQEGAVYHNLVASLSRPLVAGFYLLAMGALGFHLFHGVWSMFQSLGSSQPRYDSMGRRVATIFTIVVVGGFCLVPIAILLGYLK